MRKFLWYLTVAGSVIGMITLFLGLADAVSAPQQAAVASMAMAFAVIPYCLARAKSELEGKS